MTWIDIARAELGVAETPGADNTARILQYAQEAGFADSYKADSTPWCALFANWCLVQSGHPQTYSLMARSFLGYGKKLDKPVKGCITVLKRGDDERSGHVGFFDHEANGKVYILGGNQGDKVSVVGFPKASVIAYRMPHQKTKISRKALTVGTSITTLAVEQAIANPEAVSDAVSAIPPVPSVITETVSAASEWQTITGVLWGFKSWAVSSPLQAGCLVLLVALAAFYRPSFSAPSSQEPG